MSTMLPVNHVKETPLRKHRLAAPPPTTTISPDSCREIPRDQRSHSNGKIVINPAGHRDARSPSAAGTDIKELGGERTLEGISPFPSSPYPPCSSIGASGAFVFTELIPFSAPSLLL